MVSIALSPSLYLVALGRRLCRNELKLLFTAVTAASGFFFFFFFFGPSNSFRGGLGGGANILRGFSSAGVSDPFVVDADSAPASTKLTGEGSVLARLVSGTASNHTNTSSVLYTAQHHHQRRCRNHWTQLTCWVLDGPLLGLWLDDFRCTRSNVDVLAATTRHSLQQKTTALRCQSHKLMQIRTHHQSHSYQHVQ